MSPNSLDDHHLKPHHLATPQTNGWMNLRTATRLNTREIDDGYFITTFLPGLFAESISVRINDQHLFITGNLFNPYDEITRTGCYIRQLPKLKEIKPEMIVTYYAHDGLLIIEVQKK